MPVSGVAFRAPGEKLKGFDGDAFARLAAGCGDIALILTPEGCVIDASFASGDPTGAGQDEWIGRDWSDLVTVESRAKIADLLAVAAAQGTPRWRQVNHPTNDGDVPVRYLAVGSGDGTVVAVGQELRAVAATQQKLIK